MILLASFCGRIRLPRFLHILSPILLLTGSVCAVAQPLPNGDANPTATTEVLSIGAFGGMAWNVLHGGFSVDTDGALTDRSDCGRFENGSGGSFLVGAVIDLPIGDLLRVGFEYDYSQRYAEMRFGCIDPASTRLPDGSVVAALTDHVVDVRISTMVAAPHLVFVPFTPLPFFLKVGPSLSFNLSSEFQAREEIRTPVNAEFVTGGQVRNYGSGAFAEGGSVGIGMTGSISARLPVARNWFLEPRIGALIALGDDYQSAGLRGDRYTATLGLVRRFESERHPMPPVVDVPQVEARLDATLALSGRSPGFPGVTDTLLVRQTLGLRTELHPLLTYIFFDAGDSALPARYHQRSRRQTEEFGEQSLRNRSTIDIYHDVLDVVGLRLRRYPGSRIVVTGTQPDAPATPGLLLAERRAATVRRYLTDTWGIAQDRIRVEARLNPAALSNPDTDDGAAENRRVEISSDDYRITAPIVFTDTLVRLDYPTLEIHPAATATAGMRRWTIRVEGSTVGGDQYQQQGTSPEQSVVRIDSVLLWNTQELIASGAGPDELHLEFEVEDTRGEVRRAEAGIPLRIVRSTEEIRYGTGSYSLILFDFNSAILRPEHFRTIALVNERTDPRARARVYGFTDRLGPDDLNMLLSDRRAHAVAGEVRAVSEEIIGRGETTVLYDNDLPEGRFYSRSVTIETRRDD